MAIQAYCERCRCCCDVRAKKCPKCGEVFPRTGRKYRVDITVKGKRVTRFAGNLTLARELEGAIKGDMVRREFDIPPHKAKKPVTLGNVWEKYLPWAKEHKKSWKDDEWYYRKHIEPRFGNKALEAVTPFDIEKMKTELKKGINAQGRPFAAQTIKHQVVILRRLYNLARNWGLYDGKNPVASVQMPRVDNKKTEFLSRDEFQRLMTTIEEWPRRPTACFFKFAIYTGIRQGDLRRLTWDAIDFEHALVTLKDPKPGKVQTIPVSPEALDILREVDAVSKYVFPNPDGGIKSRSAVADTWKGMRKHAGLPADFRFHGLRHNFASWLVSNGTDLTRVQKLMGHENAATTARYAHLVPGALGEAATRSGKLFSEVRSRT